MLPPETTQIATKASNVIIESGVTGAVLIVSIIINIGLVIVLIRNMNKRVEDTNRLNDISTRMISAFEKLTAGLETINESDKEHTAGITTLNATLQSILVGIMSRPDRNNKSDRG